jgi:uncharacterized protein with von Willebrand factor type A (vWA) domain
MFFSFLDELRAAGIPASLKEHLVLLEALDRDVIDRTPEAFYYLARATFVKDEGLLDRFDQVFAKVFKGIASTYGVAPADIPEDWLKAVAEKFLTPEEMAAIKALGSWDEIMETLKKRLEEQHARHQGGSKWIGTGGTSPYGNSGYNPEGVRIGGESKHGRALKVWEGREFRNLDSTRELGTRNIKVALRRLRRFAREGAADELDIDATIDGTARQGWLDVHMRPERHNAVKLLLFLDVGDRWIRSSSSARNCSRPPRPSSRTWSSSISTIASTKACGRTIGGASPSARRPGTFSTNTATTIS